MQALILAGGEGTRMGRIPGQLPKPLLYLPGGTLLEHQLALLARLPVSETFVVTRHGQEQIGRALRGMKGVTQLPQKAPHTLLGALATAEGRVTEPFLVLHGDNYFSHRLDQTVHAAQAALEDDGVGAVFVTDSARGELEEAERLSTAGCYVLSPGLLPLVRELSEGDELLDLTKVLLGQSVPLGEVPLEGWRANVNELRDLLALSWRILERWPVSFHRAGAGAGYNRCTGCREADLPLWVSPDANVAGSRLGPFVVVGPKASVRGCELREVVVFPGVETESLRLRKAVVLPGGDGSAVLTSEDQVDGREEGHGQEEPAQLSPPAGQKQHPREQEAGEGDDLGQSAGRTLQAPN
jgi:NDP-sugar pyrophosphorylase family protein